MVMVVSRNALDIQSFFALSCMTKVGYGSLFYIYRAIFLLKNHGQEIDEFQQEMSG